MLMFNIGKPSPNPEGNPKKIDVLDKGFVKYIDHMGSDLMVVNAARVSFAKESSWEYADSHAPVPSLSNKDQKLIKYLAANKHWTPFAHSSICLHIKAPISIRTQLFKHKVGFTENEVSRRYVTDEPEYYIPQWRNAPTDGAKQGSSNFMTGTAAIEERYRNSCDDAIDAYKQLLSDGVAPEQARFVLPQGAYTEWWWTGSLSAYARVCNLRLDDHAQWEVREFATAISKIIEPLFPHSWKALVK
jgi:thymidylate synthase (FAD)